MTDAIIYSTMRSLAGLVAKFWTDWVRPAAFDHVFILGAARVRITIDEYRTIDDTQPMRAARELEVMRSEQGVDL